jgi:YidC/Oxa1 family membrane protein insertase
MSIFEILNTLLLKPLELVFEVVYMLAYKIIENPGLSIIALSLFMNFLVLPLYMRADAIQEEEHALEKKLQEGVDHIKKTFSGDERMMVLQTYYRQNHYKPVYVLRSAVSLLLQIPFFIAAYRFLSELQLINGISLGPIADLGSSDALLQVGTVSINVLPIIMTVVNLVSCVIFTKGGPLKSKIQLYAMALFFFVFLYDSPAGLVFYWTLNNVFSLVKTCFYKLKNPGKAIGVICAVIGGMIAVYGAAFYHYGYNIAGRKIFLIGCGASLQIPLVCYVGRGKWKKKEIRAEGSRKVFVFGALFLVLLTGILIPSAVIRTSPQEFVDITCFYHPLWFVVNAFCMALGLFVIWTGVFYFLARPSAKIHFERSIWALSGVAIVDYLFFGRNLGNLSSHLVFDNELQYAGREILINAAVLILVMIVFFYIYRKWKRLVAEILLTGMLAFSVMAAVNIVEINKAVRSLNFLHLEETEEIPEIVLSRNEKNVIVLMLDRAIGEYIPYMFQEKPELEEKFSGFTYYANTVSFGRFTNFSTPSLFGGYEYTPVELNRRDTESLGQKQDEALKVLPVLFDRNGYDVTVCDPPYAGYSWTPDLSIYEEYPDIKTYITEGRFTDPSIAQQGIQNNKRNFFCYSMFKAAPVCIQRLVYDKGKYNQAEFDTVYGEQIVDSQDTATGISSLFMSGYNVLDSLPEITKISNQTSGTFLMMENCTTHFPAMLQEPEYVPAVRVSNIKYRDDYRERFTIDGKSLKTEQTVQVIHYQTNMAALLKLGEWFDYLREENVYDNTRIILVSDHGEKLYQREDMILDDGMDIMAYYPLLMVKDFDSAGFKTSEEFMTCADVPNLAVKDVIEEPFNPFTGKRIGDGEKMAHPQYVIESNKNNIYENHGNQFFPAKWYAVHDDMRDTDNWKLLSEMETTLPPMEELK